MPLFEYMKQAWPLIEPLPLKPGGYLPVLCEHLEAVTDGKILKLVINIGRRLAKFTSVSVCWPSWEWGPAGLPRLRYLFTSHADSIIKRDAINCWEALLAIANKAGGTWPLQTARALL